jgi:hypothetical protein
MSHTRPNEQRRSADRAAVTAEDGLLLDAERSDVPREMVESAAAQLMNPADETDEG